jgi:ribonuclease PH
LEDNTLRKDGRAPGELRPLTLQLDFLEQTPHHVLVRAGRTVVLCVASVEESVPPWRAGSGKGWVTAEYDMLPGSTQGRKKRSGGKGDGRAQEIQRLIGRSLRAVCDLEALGERSVTVDCDVLQADGGTRTASVTGGFVALALAANTLLSRGLIQESFLTDQVAAVSVGLLGGRALLDLPYVEDRDADVDMNVVMNGEGRLIEVQGTAEGVTFSREEMDALLDLAAAGIKDLQWRQRGVLSGCAQADRLIRGGAWSHH